MWQPKEGLPGVHKDSLVRILKGVFGLATAPRHWWAKLNRLVLGRALPDQHGVECYMKAHPLDPACHYAHDSVGRLLALVVVHVDDLLIAIQKGAAAAYRSLHTMLPWGDWRGLPFVFCGKQAYRDETGLLHLTQEDYANGIE
eukprot:1914556-Lingulodinium_polyedra.AAC.1